MKFLSGRGGAVGSGREGCGRGRVRGMEGRGSVGGVTGQMGRGGGRGGEGVAWREGGRGVAVRGRWPSGVGTVLEKNGAVQVAAVRVGAARLEAAGVEAVPEKMERSGVKAVQGGGQNFALFFFSFPDPFFNFF